MDPPIDVLLDSPIDKAGDDAAALAGSDAARAISAISPLLGVAVVLGAGRAVPATWPCLCCAPMLAPLGSVPSGVDDWAKDDGERPFA